MASIKILEEMDQPEKRIHRAVQCEAIRSRMNPDKDKGLLLTLGGLFTDKKGKLIEFSEMWYMLVVLKWPAKRIISIDITAEVVNRNNTNKDPRCKGIRNIYMPLTNKREDGETCPVGWGEVGGIERVVKNLTAKGEKISVVLADLMGIVRTCAPTMIGLAQELRKQKGRVIMLGNFAALERLDENMGSGQGRYNASEELWTGSTKGSSGLTFKEACHGAWKEYTLNLNDNKANVNKQFAYTGGHAPMMTVFLEKKANTLPAKVIKVYKTGKRTGNYSAGAKKAWATRRANG
jgi:hypothetical protein